MKRDMELIREILLKIQSKADLKAVFLEFDGRDAVTVGRHVEMLAQAGLVEGILRHSMNAHGYKEMAVRDMTWEGHDFLAAMENKSVWGKIKKSFSDAELAGLPLDVLKDVGVDLLKEWAKSKVGLK